MPPTMYIQADNCSKDNKNAFLMMFLTYLIKKKIFKKVIHLITKCCKCMILFMPPTLQEDCPESLLIVTRQNFNEIVIIEIL